MQSVNFRSIFMCVKCLLSLEVVLASVKGVQGKPRISAYTLQKAFLDFFTEHKLFPPGIYADIPAVQTWALKYAVALKKLVALLKLF